MIPNCGSGMYTLHISALTATFGNVLVDREQSIFILVVHIIMITWIIGRLELSSIAGSLVKNNSTMLHHTICVRY